MTTSAESPLQWVTAGEQRHVLLERRHDFEGKPYLLTGCGWLIWPSRHDARIRDPRVCVSIESLREFARRLTFIVLISNGDAHFKNWSLIYRDQHNPTLSPAYDLVSTATHRSGDAPEDLGLKFCGSRRFGRANLSTFARLQERLNAPDAGLPDVAADIVERVRKQWPEHAALLADNKTLRDNIEESIKARARTLLER